MKITKIDATEVLDSRGNPTIMVEAWAGQHYGWTIVPSGATTGEYEAVELRDGDKKRYNGKGVLRAVENVITKIAPVLVGRVDVTDFAQIDQIMIKLDKTDNKANLGANAILGVGLACMYAAAQAKGIPPYKYMREIMYGSGAPHVSQTPPMGKGFWQESGLPLPMFNIINGGGHADNNLDIQEFMIQPISALNVTEAIRMGAEVFHSLKAVLKSKGLSTSVGDEGGFAPNLSSNREGLLAISEAITKAGYKLGKDFTLALDVAASEFWHEESRTYLFEGQHITTDQLISYYEKLCKEFPIASIEDGLDQNDWDGYVALTKRLGKSVQIMGDDFFCTNVKRLAQGIELGACNSILIKLNQIGSLTETLACIKMAHDAGYTAVISHRSGETEDTTIADLAVATNAGQIKTGALSRTDRTAKYNRLIKIEKELSL